MADTAQQILAHSALAIADWPQLWSRLLVAHVAGEDGRCRGCPSAVHVAPRWPCRISVLATTAHGLHERDARGRTGCPPEEGGSARPGCGPFPRRAVGRVLPRARRGTAPAVAAGSSAAVSSAAGPSVAGPSVAGSSTAEAERAAG